MIYKIQVVIRKLFKLAQVLFKSQDIGAEELFPLFVLCLIHCDIANLSHYISYIESYLTESQKLGEAGYCLVTLKAAYHYVITNM